MDKDELLLVPAEARGYQGNAAGLATRFAGAPGGQVLGFTPADDVPPIPIDNLPG